MAKTMRKVKSCGVLCVRSNGERSFLVLSHRHRDDLPKGHVEAGETERQTALRELAEETGIVSQDVALDSSFRFSHTYYPRYKRFGGQVVEKTVVIFLGHLRGEVGVKTSEHPNFKWVRLSEVDSLHESLRPILRAACDHLESIGTGDATGEES